CVAGPTLNQHTNTATLQKGEPMRRVDQLQIFQAAWIGALVAIFCLADMAAGAADEPLMIAKQGNFYIGGKYVESKGDMPMVGQAFIEYQIPQRQIHPYPIVMIHGGGQTGSGWISTPDGREGWAQYFLRRGYAIYIVDQVARGRSAYIA